MSWTSMYVGICCLPSGGHDSVRARPSCAVGGTTGRPGVVLSRAGAVRAAGLASERTRSLASAHRLSVGPPHNDPLLRVAVEHSASPSARPSGCASLCPMAAPRIEHATSADGTRIAWTSIGNGPALVHLPGVPLSNFEGEWRIPVLHDAFERFGRRIRLIQFDGRGTGRSQREVDDLGLDAFLADIDAVVAAAGA